MTTRSRLALAILALLVSVALVGPLLSPYDPLEQEIDRRLTPPGARHPFGTDGFGRDILSRTLHGMRVSLGVALVAVGLAAAIGVPAGLLCAWAGGTIDSAIGRVVDVFLGFPFLVMALLVTVALSPSWFVVAIAIAVATAPQIVRVARGAALAAAGEEYLTVVRSTGAGPIRIVFRHLLPASLPTVVPYLATCLGTAVAAEATLSFLGLGVPPPYPSWGRLLQEGSRAYFDAAPWVTLLPGAVLTLTVMCLIAAGDRWRSPSRRSRAIDQRRSRAIDQRRSPGS